MLSDQKNFGFQGLQIVSDLVFVVCDYGIAAAIQAKLGAKRNVYVQRNVLRGFAIRFFQGAAVLGCTKVCRKKRGRRVAGVAGYRLVVFFLQIA